MISIGKRAFAVPWQSTTLPVISDYAQIYGVRLINVLAFFCWFVFALCWIILLPEHSFPAVAAKTIPSDILKIFIKKKKSF